MRSIRKNEGNDMKIGILTASRTDNNGTDLQAYAMQELFRAHGCDAELIDYRCPKLENSRRILPGFSIKALLSVPYRVFDHISRERFRKSRFHRSKERYSANDLDLCGYDAIVVGSDQVWNPDLTGKDMGFFLPIETKSRKLSYAVSMGGADAEACDKELGIASLLKGFETVSLREESGAEAIRKLGVPARRDLDPLLMLPADRWRRLAEPSGAKKPYIAVYAVGSAYRAVNAAEPIAGELNARILLIGNPLRSVKGAKVKRFVSMRRWLGLIADAEAVVTDSYHCLSFCIAFGRPFVRMELEKASANRRLTDLIAAAGIKEAEPGKLTVYDAKETEERIAELRKESEAYIERIIGGTK